MHFNLNRQHVRDALRLGLQSAAAAAICFISLQLIGSEEKFVGVLSAVMIVQPSIGGTVSAGWERLLATFAGSLIGLGCLFLLPSGYGVAVALAVVMFVMNFISGFRPHWRGGVVAAVALALADAGGDMDIAKARAIAIGIGIFIGIAASLMVWPESSAARSMRYVQEALRACAMRFTSALRDREDGSDANEARQQFHDALSLGREAANASTNTDQSLLTDLLEAVETLYNSIIIIDRVDSPLSAFDDDILSRSNLSEAGRDVLIALADSDEDTETSMKSFSDAIAKAGKGMTGHDLQHDKAKRGISVIFGLREMEICIKKIRELTHSDSGHLGSRHSKFKELVPKALD